jgi:hypothetical protein
MAPAEGDATSPDDQYDEIDPGIEAGTISYWKARARQWEKRCRRAEREKTELIAELLKLRDVRGGEPSHAAARRAAVLGGDVYPGTGEPPRAR